MSLRTLVQLSARERGLLALAWSTVAVVRVALWVLPSRSVMRVVRRVAESREARREHRPTSTMVVWAVDAAARRVPRATCLTQAIAAQLLFRRYGYAARLALGVAPSPDGVRAHAWVERDGRVVVGGRESRQFVRLPDLDASATTAASPPALAGRSAGRGRMTVFRRSR